METQLHVELLRHTLAPEELVAMAAKLCYSPSTINNLHDKIHSKDQSAFVEKLMSMNHEPPLEHASFTFGIEGVSRALLAQITRHRLASFSVQSQRYVAQDQGSCFNYIIPPRIKALGEIHVAEYKRQMHLMHEWYVEWKNTLAEAYGAGESANEDARFVLPNASETRMKVTMNVRELRHFFSLRMCNRAQWEIRELAHQMWKACFAVAPALFADAGPGCLRGACPEGVKSCGKALDVKNERFRDMKEIGWD